MILTAYTGANADLMEQVVSLYFEKGWRVADVTYGGGAFWQKIDTGDYDFLPSDLIDGVDLRALPYETDSLDALVLDPPYTPNHDNDLKRSIADTYNLDSGPKSVPSITALYAGGLIEAARCVRSHGIVLVKCQDVIENHERHWTHIHIHDFAASIGLKPVDLFVLVQSGKPAMRHESQEHARANHSYLWVLRRARRPW